MDLVENILSSNMRLTGISFLWIQVVVLLTALYLKINKPDLIANINALNKSLKYLFLSLLIPSIKSVISIGAVPFGFGLFFLFLKIVLHIGVAVLMVLSIHQLWKSIKYSKIEKS